MKVKRLDIQGFKSFKDKTVIHFDEGVTGIVGPNGCGKSNIVDAFFWVMGEQSVKHMRADGQLDLIFNGSEKYAPLSMAEVTMTLATGASAASIPEGASVRDLPAHMKYDEISVTRRLFRDATSEYLINGQPCRLKDVHELFMDTGAGPKAYSIVEQGQIAKIISSKPEDRRVLIEEAAGIVKFKARKKESLRKIEATRLNLLRINDIITEIERQLASLERQAQKARLYKNYKEELLGKEMLVGRKKLFGLKNRIIDAESRVKELGIAEVESRGACQTAGLRIENFKIQMAEAQRMVEDGQVALQGLQREISQDDTKLQLQRRQVQELETSSGDLDTEGRELKTEIERLRAQKEAFESEARGLQALFDGADATLKDHQARLDQACRTAGEMGTALEREKRELMASVSRQGEISKQVHGLEAKVDALSGQVRGLAAKIAERESERAELAEKETAAKALFESATSDACQARETAEKLKAEIQTLESRLTQLRANESAAREEFAKVDSKQKTLEALVAGHEGMRSDVREILRNPEFTDGLRGLFADGVEAHPGYEYALESVLRDYLENLFVENALAAARMLSALKERDLGRATFWALDLFEESFRALSPATFIAPSKALPLADVIRIRHEKAAAILQLFGRFYVVETLDEAIAAFHRSAGTGLSFVTREGDLVDRFGRISGGNTKPLEGGILARKAELQKLTDSLVEIKSRARSLRESLHALEASLVEKRAASESVNARLRDLDLSAKSAERDLASAGERLRSANSELEEYRRERDGIERERKNLWEKLDAIRRDLSGIEESTRDREKQIGEKSAGHAAAAAKVSEIQGTLVQFRIDFTSANEKLRHGRENLERVESELTGALSRKEEAESLLNRKLDEKDMIARDLTMLDQSLRGMSARAQALEESLRASKNEYEKINARMSEAFEQQRTTMRALEEATGELGRLKLEFEKCSLEYQMLFQSMFQRYGLEEPAIAPRDEADRADFDALTPEKEVELQAEVDRLHERIRRLGEVNVMSVEEYDEQKKRHEFLLGQREDLTRSIEDLERAIERINKTSEERFKIAFEEINKRFERIFPIVFGGGWGRLEMTNPADLNETGVDIIAEPPGKKVGSIQLMSGGEKALTAVALIFSIFLIKPSPFCVLDEVDAPLDDHNVGKFNALLKEMAVKSQFIIITHNKRTMELNDKLYGVTMEEPGVSKMVSILLQ